MNLPRLRKYLAITRTQIINSAAYPIDLAARSLMIVMFMIIFVQLWSATYRALGETSIAGLTLNQTVWYVTIAETIVLSKSRLTNTIAEQVKDGSIAYILNKPYDFLLYHISVALGDGVVRMFFNMVVGGLTTWLMVGPPPNLLATPFVMIAILLAWLIDCTLTAMIGLAAFVTEDVAAFDWIYSKFVLILGGVLIPLDFFPDWLRGLVQLLPFAYTTYYPARFFVQPDLARFVALIVGQLCWLLVLGSLLSVTYRRGVTRLTINGG